MPTIRKPRSGSLQFWPRKRAKRSYARVRAWAASNEAKLMGFAGYKVGMTHLIVNDNRKTSTTKGMDIQIPVTIIECPPLKVAGIRFYQKDLNGSNVVGTMLADSFEKELSRKISIPKKKKDNKVPEAYDDLRLIVYTQPKLTNIGRKKPEVFEMAVGGKKDEQLKFAQEKLGKDLLITETFKEGELVDIHAITTAKGMQGPVKRFGISLKQRKTEKGIRGPGSLGPWISQGHHMWRKPKAGKMGYHTRTEHNKWIIKISDKDDLVKKGGFEHYGVIKNPYILLKGSIIGPKKRLVRLTEPTRPNKKIPGQAPMIKFNFATYKK